MNTARWLVLIFSAVFPGATLAADYPSRPIRFVVPYPPSGAADIVARILAQKLGDALGATVVVDNRAGAGGNLGTDLVAKAAPDGYTLLMGNVGPLAINVSLVKRLPYDPLKDLAPVSFMVVYPNVLVVNPSLPVKSVSELIAFAKARPGQLSYGSAGTGSSTHLAAELFKSMAGIEMAHVPYKGGGQAVIDVMSGQVQLYFSSMLGALPHLKSGKLRALAVTGSKRSRAAPELPTIADAGISRLRGQQLARTDGSGRHPRARHPAAESRDFEDIRAARHARAACRTGRRAGDRLTREVRRVHPDGDQEMGESREEFGRAGGVTRRLGL